MEASTQNCGGNGERAQISAQGLQEKNHSQRREGVQHSPNGGLRTSGIGIGQMDKILHSMMTVLML